jgi:hypothetical protein
LERKEGSRSSSNNDREEKSRRTKISRGSRNSFRPAGRRQDPVDWPYNRPGRSHGRQTGPHNGGSGATTGWTGYQAGLAGNPGIAPGANRGRRTVCRAGSPGAQDGRPGLRSVGPAPRPIGPGPRPAISGVQFGSTGVQTCSATYAADVCSSRSGRNFALQGGRH